MPGFAARDCLSPVELEAVMSAIPTSYIVVCRLTKIMTILAALNDKARHHLGQDPTYGMPGAGLRRTGGPPSACGTVSSSFFDAGHSQCRPSASLFHIVVTKRP